MAVAVSAISVVPGNCVGSLLRWLYAGLQVMVIYMKMITLYKLCHFIIYSPE